MHQFYRYVGLINDATIYPSIKKVESVTKIDENRELDVYTLDFLQKYSQELFDIISKSELVSKKQKCVPFKIRKLPALLGITGSGAILEIL